MIIRTTPLQSNTRSDARSPPAQILINLPPLSPNRHNKAQCIELRSKLNLECKTFIQFKTCHFTKTLDISVIVIRWSRVVEINVSFPVTSIAVTLEHRVRLDHEWFEKPGNYNNEAIAVWPSQSFGKETRLNHG